ncbi:MAG: FliO/MopB family protein [Alphaproteobacteria bacterium]|nr:FliO/MopB family protein [Alphaproteobacteria bacterium]
MLDLDVLLRFSFALGIVLALIAGATWLAKRHLGTGTVLAGGRRRRLVILESAAIDNRTRLVLVRHDDTEHLLACGPAGVTRLHPGRPAAETPS